jgi:hypothetical protein
MQYRQGLGLSPLLSILSVGAVLLRYFRNIFRIEDTTRLRQVQVRTGKQPLADSIWIWSRILNLPKELIQFRGKVIPVLEPPGHSRLIELDAPDAVFLAPSTHTTVSLVRGKMARLFVRQQSTDGTNAVKCRQSLDGIGITRCDCAQVSC